MRHPYTRPEPPRLEPLGDAVQDHIDGVGALIVLLAFLGLIVLAATAIHNALAR